MIDHDVTIWYARWCILWLAFLIWCL